MKGRDPPNVKPEPLLNAEPCLHHGDPFPQVPAHVRPPRPHHGARRHHNERTKGVNITKLSKAVGQSYQYTILIIKDLEKRGLVVKETKGVASVLRPDETHPVIDWIKKTPG